jgi:hypothetical protein
MKNRIKFLWIARSIALLSASLVLAGMAGCSTNHSLTLSPSRPIITRGGPAKLKDVNLFPNGVGVFEYQGTAVNNMAQSLTFRSDQIDDVLASLVFQDAGGGRAGEITFPANVPLAEELRRYPVSLGNSPSRAQILSQLRGIMVTIRLKKPAGASLTGRIIGVRKDALNPPPGNGPMPLVVRVGSVRHTIHRKVTESVNLLCGGTLRQIAMANVSAVTIRSDAIRRSLKEALDMIAARRGRRTHPLTVWFHGRGRRTVGFAYLMETPVWRMTYRLIIPAPGAHHVQPILQAMALITNRSNTDWNDIRLDLRGGEPLSFIAHLYQPLYQRRPIKRNSSSLHRSPQTWGRGEYYSSTSGPLIMMRRGYQYIDGHVEEVKRTAPVGGGGVGNIGGGGSIFQINRGGFQPPAAPTPPFNPLQGVHAMAEASDVYPAFDYHVDNLNVRRGHSAMVPILVAPITGTVEDYYSAGDLVISSGGKAHHPMQGIRVDNTTGHFLPPGVTSVYRGAVFAGQAQLPVLPSGVAHIVTFAIDRSTNIHIHQGHHTHWRSIHAAVKFGQLVMTKTMMNRYRIKVSNHGDQAKIINIQTQIKRRDLISPRSLLTRDKSGKMCTFKIMLKPHSGQTIAISVRNTANFPVSLDHLDSHDLTALLKEYPHLPPTIVAAVKRGRRLRILAENADRRATAIQAKIAGITKITANLEKVLLSIKKVSPSYNKIAAMLSEQSTRYVTLSGELNTETAALTHASKLAARYWARLHIRAEPYGR